MNRRAELAWGAAGVGMLLGAWALAAAYLAKPHVLPGPALVAETLLSMRGALAVAAARSFARVGVGWSCAAGVALPVGWAMGAAPALDRELRGLLSLLRPIPPFAWLPLLLLWVGIGEPSAVIVCFVAALFPILAHARQGAAEVPAALLAAGENLGASGWFLWLRLRVPAALPLSFTGLRAGWSLAWMSVVAAELVGADGGLGQLILDSRNLARPDLAIAGMGVLGVVAASTGGLLSAAERRMIR